MTTPPPRQRITGKKGAPPAGFPVAGLLVPVLVFLLVTGAGVAALTPRGGPEPTFTERAQQASADRARDLAADAAVLAASAPAAGYAEAAELLAAQSRGLAPAGPDGARGEEVGTRSGTQSSTQSGAPGATAESAAPAGPVTPAGFLKDLTASAGRNLSDAVKAEPGIARLLASVGSSQWQQAASLGALLGVPVQAPAAAGLNAADGPACTDGPRGSAEGRRALLSAVRTEDRAVYAYEVAAARLPDPEPLLAASREHAAVAAAASSALAGLCAAPAPLPPAYALAPEFLADPAAGIARLEQELSVFYGSMVGAGGPAVRGWAVGRLTTAVQRSFALDGVAEPFPGIPVEEQALPAVESTDGPNAEDTGKP